jgi:hypothetical protein
LPCYGRVLRAIVSALLLDAVGIPRVAFAPVFAVSRCAGWLAHAMEQQKTGRMSGRLRAASALLPLMECEEIHMVCRRRCGIVGSPIDRTGRRL